MFACHHVIAFGLLVACVLTMEAGTYENPVINNDCPDPGVYYDNSTKRYFTVTTGTGRFSGGYFPIYTSEDLAEWKHIGFIFEKGHEPAWIENSYWAPEIHKVGNKIHAYYTARDKTGRLSIGVAVADKPQGPYHSPLKAPLQRKSDMGCIDATLMYIGDAPYLIWKDDGNDCGKPTPIWAKKMQPNGLNFTGEAAVELISNTLPWEGPLVEGPWHIFRAPYHYIFYSANGYASDKYAVGVARSTSALGPYTKKGEPILRSNEKWIGPGHCSVISKQGKNEEFIMVYHSWIKDHVGDGKVGRKMLMDVVKWSSDGWPEIQGGTPSIKPQPKP